MPEYGDKNYWDHRYSTSGNTLFDWYVDYEGVKPFVELVPLRYDNQVLILGCGTSPLGENLYDDGFRKVTAIDNSAAAISMMKERSQFTRPELKYSKMDAVRLSLPAETFTLVVDKGTIDCVLCKKDAMDRVHDLCAQVSRVMAPEGVFISYSFASPEDRDACFNKPEFNWYVTRYMINKPSIEDLRAGKKQDFTPKVIKDWTLESVRTDPDDVHFIYVMRKHDAPVDE